MAGNNAAPPDARPSTPLSFDDCDTTVQQYPSAETLAVQTVWYPLPRNLSMKDVAPKAPTIQGTFKMSLKGLEHWMRVIVEGVLDKRVLTSELQSVRTEKIVVSIVRSVCLALSKKLYRGMTVQSRSSIDEIGELFDSISIGIPSVLAGLINSFGPVRIRDMEFRAEFEGIWVIHLINLFLRDDFDILEEYNARHPLLSEKFPSLNKTFVALFEDGASQLAQSDIFPSRFKSRLVQSTRGGTWSSDIEHGYEANANLLDSVDMIEAAEGFRELWGLRSRLLRAKTKQVDSKALIGDLAISAGSWATDFTILELKTEVKKRLDDILPVNQCIGKVVDFAQDVETLFTHGGGMWQLMSLEEGTLSTPFEVSHDEANLGISLQIGKAHVKIPQEAYKIRGPEFESERILIKRRELALEWSLHLLKDSTAPGSRTLR